MTVEYPKRTFKKSANTAQIIRAASDLFTSNGYQFTKLEEVAAEAGVHVQTLYRHFKTKDDLAIAAAEGVLMSLRKYFEVEFSHRNTFQVWREFVGKVVVRLAPFGWEHKRSQLHAASSLMNDNFLVIVYSGYEDILTGYLAKDFQMNPKQDRLPRQVASFLCSSQEAVLKRCGGLDTGTDILSDSDAVLHECQRNIDDIEAMFTSWIKRSKLEGQERSA